MNEWIQTHYFLWGCALSIFIPPQKMLCMFQGLSSTFGYSIKYHLRLLVILRPLSPSSSWHWTPLPRYLTWSRRCICFGHDTRIIIKHGSRGSVKLRHWISKLHWSLRSMLALVPHWRNGIIAARWSFATRCRGCFCFRHDARVFIVESAVCITFRRCSGKSCRCAGWGRRRWSMIFASVRLSKSRWRSLNFRHDAWIIFKQVSIVGAYSETRLVGPTKEKKRTFHNKERVQRESREKKFDMICIALKKQKKKVKSSLLL